MSSRLYYTTTAAPQSSALPYPPFYPAASPGSGGSPPAAAAGGYGSYVYVATQGTGANGPLVFGQGGYQPVQPQIHPRAMRTQQQHTQTYAAALFTPGLGRAEAEAGNANASMNTVGATGSPARATWGRTPPQQREQQQQLLQVETEPIRPQFRSKIVCELTCRHCEAVVCRRGMKAILLADMNIELFSTDVPPHGVQLVNNDYQTRNCYCRIRDVACLGCGNVIGYHVTQPCEPCMEACNNGHFWMFHISEVSYADRLDTGGTRALLWAQLPKADTDLGRADDYEAMCR